MKRKLEADHVTDGGKYVYASGTLPQILPLQWVAKNRQIDYLEELVKKQMITDQMMYDKSRVKRGGFTPDEYQKWTNTTAVFAPAIDNVLNGGNRTQTALLLYLANTINEEAGELAGKIKRLIRDHGGELNDEIREAMGKELGDILYYVAQYAQASGYTLQEIFDMNVEKLMSRKERGAIKGAGDDR